jgi:hypothetical protein
MNLPVAVDVAIGILFIYLMLSLLASEIQELIATVLQWRAEHLKKSIEILMTSNHFTDRMYRSPLIQSLNQTAKGGLAVLVRQLSHFIHQIYRLVTGTRNVFAPVASGPSYIPAETFAVALLQQINLVELSRRISELSFERLQHEKLALLKEILNDLRDSLGSDPLLIDVDREFDRLEQNLREVSKDFRSGRTSLSGSIQQATDQIFRFIDSTEVLLANQNPCNDIIRSRLNYLKQLISRKYAEPTVVEVLKLILEEGDYLHLSPRLVEIVDEIRDKYPELLNQVSDLPAELKRNLIVLAEQAQLRAESLEVGVRQMEKEVAIWFDNSMARASGVYKRNAKGVALIIGFLIAVTINADTLYIINRLSKDTTLRSTLSQRAERLVPSDPAATTLQADLEAVKVALDNVLNDVSLPLGWNAANVRQQGAIAPTSLSFVLHRLAGWLVTGIALSMGAAFWYDLLSKVMRVRNTGRVENGSTSHASDNSTR